MMGQTIFKRDKGKGTSPIPSSLHHPATAGWDGEKRFFTTAKVGYSRFSARGQFRERGPNQEPTDFDAKMGQNSPPVKNWVFCEKTGKPQLADFL
jgi:hypothetical protein